MNPLEKATVTLVRACDGNPVLVTLTVVLFWFMFTVFEASIEKAVFGERFEHLLDPVFAIGFIAFAAYAVWWCALWKAAKAAASGQ